MGEAMQVNFLQEYKRLCLLRDIPGAKKQKVDAKALARRMLARQVPSLIFLKCIRTAIGFDCICIKYPYKFGQIQSQFLCIWGIWGMINFCPGWLVSSVKNAVHVTLDIFRLVRNISSHCGSSARLRLLRKRFKLDLSMSNWWSVLLAANLMQPGRKRLGLAEHKASWVLLRYIQQMNIVLGLTNFNWPRTSSIRTWGVCCSSWIRKLSCLKSIWRTLRMRSEPSRTNKWSKTL